MRIAAIGPNHRRRAVNLPAPDPTASWYVRRDEQRQAAHAALGAALGELVHRMKERTDLPDLQILEMVFYGQHSNQRIAAELGVDANHVALLKHRWIKQLRERVEQSMQKSPPSLGFPRRDGLAADRNLGGPAAKLPQAQHRRRLCSGHAR